jgi:hypothetical protein
MSYNSLSCLALHVVFSKMIFGRLTYQFPEPSCMRYNIFDLNLAKIWIYTAFQKVSLQNCVRRAISYKML